MKKYAYLLLAGMMVLSLGACGDSASDSSSSSQVSDGTKEDPDTDPDIDPDVDVLPDDDPYVINEGDGLAFTESYAYMWKLEGLGRDYDVFLDLNTDATWRIYSFVSDDDFRDGTYELVDDDDNVIVLHCNQGYDDVIFTREDVGLLVSDDVKAKIHADLAGNTVYVSDYGDILIAMDDDYDMGVITNIAGYWDYTDSSLRDGNRYYFDGVDHWCLVCMEDGSIVESGTYEIDMDGDCFLTEMDMYFDDGRKPMSVMITGGSNDTVITLPDEVRLVRAE